MNGRFARFDWTPVHYLNRALPRRTLAGLYRASRVGIVTPMRDGMNLVAMEYLAAQDPADPGVLVLSRFAGAAQYLREALLVNPYDGEETAKAMHLAREMPIKERRRRHEALMRRLRARDVGRWRKRLHRGACRRARLAAAVAKGAMILVGDVGGTRTRFALATKASGAWQLSNVEDGPTTPDVASAIARYLGTKAREGVTAAAFGAAGAVSPDGSIRLTNVDIRLEPGALARAAGLARVVLVNDFGAIAEAVPHLPRESLVHCGGGQVVEGQPVAVLGPGLVSARRSVPGVQAGGLRFRATAAIPTWRRSTMKSSKPGSACAGRMDGCQPKRYFAGRGSNACMRWFPVESRFTSQRSTRPPGAGSRMRYVPTLSSRAGLAASPAILPSSPARGAVFISRAESCRAGAHASMPPPFAAPSKTRRRTRTGSAPFQRSW